MFGMQLTQLTSVCPVAMEAVSECDCVPATTVLIVSWDAEIKL